MKTKTINVTERDIKNGMPGDCVNCPVSLAVRRAFKKGGDHISVLEGMYIGREPLINVGRKEIPAPKVVVDFAKAFDKGRILKPFTFTLEY